MVSWKHINAIAFRLAGIHLKNSATVCRAPARLPTRCKRSTDNALGFRHFRSFTVREEKAHLETQNCRIERPQDFAPTYVVALEAIHSEFP